MNIDKHNYTTDYNITRPSGSVASSWITEPLHVLDFFKETQSNMSQVFIECIDKVIQNALIFMPVDCKSIKTR